MNVMMNTTETTTTKQKPRSGYGKKKMIEEAIYVIEKYNLIYIDEIFPYVKYTREMFLKDNLDECSKLDEAIENTKVKNKVELREEMRQGTPAQKLNLYKLYSNADELSIITGKKKGLDKDEEGNSYDTVVKLN